ncbi:hypothetical protein ACFSKI_17330 [Pseudogracilibacillus auburnensis]|uniref:YesK-like protein n=1 Tax=Pseudogracilibacillus auburnensis TaxID=1494959 RepID=A0A2V3WAT7_9BACI|nr:hypothetical protein [Pseudogracilibacillus auburnensis]MBO1003577.1 hypothetical protein [Pseudogracilibacillus auburnensis]PXW89265.1 hypothetical protein DFR56_10241 [Pseudogracilibacillus auburnensis]
MINFHQLEVLGFTKEYQYIVILFITIFFLSFIIKPIVMLVIHKQYFFVLTYTVSSLLLIIIAFIIAYFTNELIVIKTAFQVVILFGICFAIFIMYKLIKRQMKSV